MIFFGRRVKILINPVLEPLGMSVQFTQSNFITPIIPDAIGAIGGRGVHPTMFILRLALIMVLLVQPAIAKRVSEIEFQRMTRAFPPLGGAAVERIGTHEDWELWSSGFPTIQGARACKPVVTGAGGLHMSIMSLVKTEKLDDTIVPMTGLKPNDTVLDKVRTALEPHFRNHCQQIGKPIDIWLGFKYADIASDNAEVVYNLTWDGQVIGYRQYPTGTIDATPINSRAFKFGKFVAKEITKRTVALRHDTFFHQLLGGADPYPPVPVVVREELPVSSGGQEKACKTATRKRVIQCEVYRDSGCTGMQCRWRVSCDDRREPERYKYCRDRIAILASELGTYYCDPADSLNFDMDINRVLKDACR
jgi:hypothetical protein